jgi:hypothetical protein
MVRFSVSLVAAASALLSVSNAAFSAEEYESGAAHHHIMEIKMVNMLIHEA